MVLRRHVQPTALVAAASRPLIDRAAATPRQAQQWQGECWTMFDEIGEVKYACNLAGNAMAKLRLYVAVYPADDPTNDPVPVLTDGIDSEAVDPDLAAAAEAELARLSSAEGGLPEVLRSLNINLEVAGELWLVGWDARGPGEAHGPSPEHWEVRSVSEVSWSGAGDDRVAKVSVPGELPREVVKGRDGIVRVWVRHPRYGELADSNLRGVLADCRAILVLQQQAIAESRSRMSAGAFTVPNELTIASVRLADGSRPPDDPDTDPFLLALEAAMIDPVEDLSNPGSVSPFVIRGPAEFLQPQYLRRIELGRQSQDIEAKVEQRVMRLARGMNLPPEAVLGHQQTTFANAAQVDQDTFEDHYEPRARLLVDSLTVAYLRPGLIDAGWPDDQVRRLFVWYDPSLLIGSPDTDANADEAFTNQAISWSAYRRAKGFDEADAPSAQEQLARTGLLRGIVNPELTAQLLNLIEDPHGDPVPVITPPATNTPGDVVNTAGIAQEAELILALINAGHLEVAPDGSLRGRHPLALGVIEAAATTVEDNPGRVLLDIDRETRAKLQSAVDSALLRALERAGNRIKGKAAQHRATLRHVDATDCAPTLGPSLVAAAGLGDDDLLQGSWDALEAQYYRLGASAQKRALGFAGRITGGFRPADRAAFGLRQAGDLDEGWAWMKENLTALAKARLYEPNPRAPDLGEFDPTSQVPTGLIRQAMRVAGGVSPSDNAAQISTNGEGSAWITTPDGSSPGGIATGQLISDIIRDEGGAIQGYRWVYGPADRRHTFHPHLELDGFIFHSFTDPRLVIHSGFPSTGHYIPGDHRGCICDVEPIILTAEQVEQMRREGRLGGEVATPPPPPEPPPRPKPYRAKRRKLPEGPEPPYVKDARQFVTRSKARVTKARAAVTRQHTLIRQTEEQLAKVRAEGRPVRIDFWERQLKRHTEELPRLEEHKALAEEVLRGHQLHLDEMLDAWVEAGPLPPEVIPEAPTVDALAERALRRQDPYPRHLSAREAEDWVVARWGGLTERGKARTISIGHLPDDAANSIARAWTEMAQEYPKTAERIQFIGDSGSIDPIARQALRAGGPNLKVQPIGERAIADAWDWVDARWIRVNSNYYGTESDFANISARRQTWVAGNGSHHPIGTGNMDGTIHHEFGHHLHYEAKHSAGYGVVDSQIDGILDKALRESSISLKGASAKQKALAREKFIASRVSKYATAGQTKHGELVAEIVSWRHGTRWDEAPSWVKAIYQAVREGANISAG